MNALSPPSTRTALSVSVSILGLYEKKSHEMKWLHSWERMESPTLDPTLPVTEEESEDQRRKGTEGQWQNAVPQGCLGQGSKNFLLC